jgi:ribosomal protein S18
MKNFYRNFIIGVRIIGARLGAKNVVKKKAKSSIREETTPPIISICAFPNSPALIKMNFKNKRLLKSSINSVGLIMKKRTFGIRVSKTKMVYGIFPLAG